MQVLFPWASATTRILHGARHIEVEWMAGPIPFEDGWGRELVVRCMAAASFIHGMSSCRQLPAL